MRNEHHSRQSAGQEQIGADSAQGNWQRRHEKGEYGRYGNYGSSDDQWDVEWKWVGEATGGQRYGVLPGPSRNAPVRRFAPGYEASRDADPYRHERIYGYYAADLYDDAHEQPHPGPVDAGVASLQDQFGGVDRTLDRVSGWNTGPQSLPGKGGSRPDDRIHEDICERLSCASGIEIEDVSVRVSGGTVTLEGTVPTGGMKHMIENIADACAGVQEVDNRIKIRRISNSVGRDPSGLAAAVDDSRLLNGRQR